MSPLFLACPVPSIKLIFPGAFLACHEQSLIFFFFFCSFDPSPCFLFAKLRFSLGFWPFFHFRLASLRHFFHRIPGSLAVFSASFAVSIRKNGASQPQRSFSAAAALLSLAESPPGAARSPVCPPVFFIFPRVLHNFSPTPRLPQFPPRLSWCVYKFPIDPLELVRPTLSDPLSGPEQTLIPPATRALTGALDKLLSSARFFLSFFQMYLSPFLSPHPPYPLR